MKKKSTNKKKIILLALAILIVTPALFIILSHFEGEKPVINVDLPLRSVGISGKISGTVSDSRSGIKTLWIALSKDGTEKVLVEKEFPKTGVLSKGTVKDYAFETEILPGKLGMKDGKALLRIRVTDYSWRGLLSGNIGYLEKELNIDTNPPEIDILSKNHNLVRGGSGLIVFKVSEADVKTGVKVGDNYFPAYSGCFDDASVMVAFFALSHKQGPGTTMFVEAVDQAGNASRAGFVQYIGKKQFRNDRINISDNFLNTHMPGFRLDDSGKTISNNLEKFLKINSEVRRRNGAEILSPGSKTDPAMYWKGAFQRLPGSATRANYADYRSYFYNGKVIDRQYHLGIDLASVKHAQVPAANAGKVVLVGNIGIYGRTVVIDHGFGLFSTYSHLSRVEVLEGQAVTKGEIIGRTGVTGLVGGDHLHYGMFVHNVFVDPLQWWDPKWIENNIMSKIDDVRAGL